MDTTSDERNIALAAAHEAGHYIAAVFSGCFAEIARHQEEVAGCIVIKPHMKYLPFRDTRPPHHLRLPPEPATRAAIAAAGLICMLIADDGTPLSMQSPAEEFVGRLAEEMSIPPGTSKVMSIEDINEILSGSLSQAVAEALTILRERSDYWKWAFLEALQNLTIGPGVDNHLREAAASGKIPIPGRPPEEW